MADNTLERMCERKIAQDMIGTDAACGRKQLSPGADVDVALIVEGKAGTRESAILTGTLVPDGDVRCDSGLDQPTQELAGAIGGIADETLCLSASVFLLKRLRLHRRQSMSKKAAESHKKASEHLTHAAHH
jgi:hypothetical protein